VQRQSSIEANFGLRISARPVGMTDMKQLIVVLLTIFTALSSVWANLSDSDDKIENS
jgi:hypothetical protein